MSPSSHSKAKGVAIVTAGKLGKHFLVPIEGFTYANKVPKLHLFQTEKKRPFTAQATTAIWKNKHPKIVSEMNKTKKWLRG